MTAEGSGRGDTVATFLEQFLPYIALATSLAGTGLRVGRWIAAPVPFPLTLFPAPAGGGGRLAAVTGELLSLGSMFREDRRLWFWAWLFHASLGVVVFGHALGIGFLRGQFAFLGLSRAASESLSHTLGGAAGAAMSLSLGALLWRRIARPGPRSLSGPGSYTGPVLLLAVAATGLLLSFVGPAVELRAVRAYLGGLLALRPIPLPPGRLLSCHVLLVNLLLLYFPFSRLLHSVGFFFARAMLVEAAPAYPTDPGRPPRSEFAREGGTFAATLPLARRGEEVDRP